MGYTKRNKKCIPKEGMPHTHKACQKKREDAYPNKVCLMSPRHDKKKKKKKEKRCIPKEGVPHTHKVCQKKRERKRKYSPYQKHYKGERIHIKDYHPSSTKNIHTLAHLDQGLWLVSSFGSGLWLSEIWEASLPLFPPYLQIHQKEPLEVGWKNKGA